MNSLPKFTIPFLGALLWLAPGCGDNDVCGEGFAEQDGICVTATECGAGTVAVGGQCVPDGSIVCAQGTVFDTETSTCVIDPTQCAAGTVFAEGTCIPEDEALEGMADFVEGPEPNDGVTAIAGMFPAPAVGESVSIYGCIEPRVDGDEDGNLDADFDVWVVTATGPTVLDITADGIRGLSAGYILLNADATNSPALDSWQRFGVNLTGDTSKREVYLPAAGIYALQMADSRSLFLDSAGGEGACYFTTIEAVELPEATPLVVGQNSGVHDGKIQIFSYAAATEAEVIDVRVSTTTAQVSPAIVGVRAGALSSVSDGVNRVTLGGLATANDPVEFIYDPVFNFALVPQPFALDAFVNAPIALPTDGTTVSLTKKNGDSGVGGNPDLLFRESNFLYFDVGAAGAILQLDVAITTPVIMAVMGPNVLSGNAFDVRADYGSLADTIDNEFQRFLAPGRYFFLMHDITGTSGDTFDVTATVTEFASSPITYGAALTNQTLDGTPGFHTLATNNPVWSEFNVTNTTDFGGGATIAGYDVAGEGWINGNDGIYQPIVSRGVADDGTQPFGLVLRGDNRDMFVTVNPAAAGAGPAYDIEIGDRDFVDLAAIAAGVDIDRAAEAIVADSGNNPQTIRRFLVSGAAADELTITATPAAGEASDIVVARVDRLENQVGVSNAGGDGVAEVREELFRLTPQDFVAFVVGSFDDEDSTFDLNLSAVSPVPYDIAAGALTYADVCGEAGAVQLFDDAFAGSTSVSLPAGFANFELFGKVVDNANVGVASNGFISFAGVGSGFFSDEFPSESSPDGIVAPFWATLDVVDTCQFDGADTVTFQWTGVDFSNSSLTIEMQLILHTNGVIDFVYGPNHILAGDVAAFGSSVGAENLDGLFGHQLFLDEDAINPGDSWVWTPAP